VGGVRAWDELSQDAQQALRTIGFLELPVTSRTGIGAIVTTPDVESVLRELVDGGWLTRHGERLNVAGQQVAVSAISADTVARYADELLGYLEGVGARADSLLLAEVVAVVRGAGRTHAFLWGARLADAAWRQSNVFDHVTPEQWLPLCEAGERCATEAQNPRLLISLLRHSGAYFATVDRRHLTESQWLRALSLARQADDVDTADAISRALAELYREWGRLHKALDVLQNLVHYRREKGNDQPLGVAEALGDLGATLLQANRPADAVDILIAANTVLRDVSRSVTPEIVILHGTVLTTLGKACEAQGEPAKAARHYSRALALLIDVDERAAQEVRDRLAHASRAARRRG
jgi:tetratricopeptide (TPR) repeat protein